MKAVQAKDDSRLAKARTIFNALATDMAKFFEGPDRSINFTFYTKDDEHFMRVRFVPTKKVILCSVSNDEEVHSVTVRQLEKTMNIVENIDTIYHERTKVDIPLGSSFKAELTAIFNWGLRKSKARAGGATEVARGRAIELTKDTVMKDDLLYYGIIVEVVEVTKQSDTTNLTKIRLLNDTIVPVVVARDANVEVGRVFVCNKAGRHNFLTYPMAKNHLVFSMQDMESINLYFGVE